MTKAANDYYDAHGYPSGNHENKLNKTKQFIPSKQNNEYNSNSKPPTTSAGLHCNNGGLNKHDTSNCRKKNANNSNIICYTCEKPGHKLYQCPLNKIYNKYEKTNISNTKVCVLNGLTAFRII